MQGRFFPDVFSRAGIALAVPTEEEQAYVHDQYMDELVNGIFRAETRDRLLQIIVRLKERESVQGVILGGTELPLLLRDAAFPDIPFLDTTQIHVRSAVAQML